MRFPVPFIALFFALASCGSDSPAPGDGGGEGGFKVFVSKSGGGERAEMEVTEDTTFGEVRSFAATEFNLAAGDFRLMVAGKYPGDTEKLGDYDLKAPGGPTTVPAGNIIVRVND